MKLTLFVALCLTPFNWSPSASAETIRIPDLGLVVSDEGNVDVVDDEVQKKSSDTERSLQTNTCGTTTQWEDFVVVELGYNSDVCFQGINVIDTLPNATWTSLLKNTEISSLVKELETSYQQTYEWMQGQDIRKGDYCMHCDPYARKITAASVQKVSKRSGTSILAVEMKVTSTCQGCNGLTANMAIFDRPSAALTSSATTINCACTKGIGKNRVRAPYEAEFGVQFQQVVQTYQNKCARIASGCSYGTPFEVDMAMDIDVDGTSLTESQRRQAVEAFMRASNTAYAATVANCQPEFRRLEHSNSHGIVVRSLRTDSEDPSTGEPVSSSVRDLQQSKFTRMTFKLKTGGTCNACSNKAFIGNRPDTLKIVSRPKSRELQQTYDLSHCFCPLGSSVAQEPIGRATLMRLFREELSLIGSPIKNVTSMSVVADSSNTPPRRVRRLQDTSPNPAATARSRQASVTPDPPSACPMVTLDFWNVTNPLAHYYGQSSTLKAGDYLYDQLWWSHGVKVLSYIRLFDQVSDSGVFMPKFVRGTGWVDVKANMTGNDFQGEGGAVRLLDTMRPTSSLDPRYHQLLCENTERHGDIGARHLGSPNRNCPGGGPGK